MGFEELGFGFLKIRGKGVFTFIFGKQPLVYKWLLARSTSKS